MATQGITSQQLRGSVVMSEDAQRKQPTLVRAAQSETQSVSFWDSAWTGEQVRKLGLNDVADFLTDKDKVCTDGKDDGKISAWEKIKAAGKGLIFGIPKAIVNHPVATAVTVALGAGAMIATGGAALPLLVGAGFLTGGAQVGIGAYNAVTATTDGEAKAAWEGIGTGVATMALSASAAKSANQMAANGGVKSLQGLENESWSKNFTAMWKAIPEAGKQSGLNIKGNALTWTSAIKGDNVIYANSNKLRALGEPQAYMSKANDVEAYRFNPNGTTEEILANNPHVEQVNGRFGVVDKWSTQSLQEAIASGQTEEEAVAALKFDSSKVSGGKVYHTIDPNKNPMVMIYDEAGNDFAICEGNVFKGSYVETHAFKADGSLNYQDPTKLAYGQRIQATKQAPGSFVVAPEGTQVQTISEGIQTVQKGQVVALDHEGNPYVTTVENIVKRNTGLSDNAMHQLYELDPQAVAKRAPNWYQKTFPEEVARKAYFAAKENLRTSYNIETVAVESGSAAGRDLASVDIIYEGTPHRVVIGAYEYREGHRVLEALLNRLQGLSEAEVRNVIMQGHI